MNLKNGVLKIAANLYINLDTAELCSFSGKWLRLRLPPKQRGILTYFAANPNRMLSRDQILDYVWGYDSDITGSLSRQVDKHIGFLRESIARFSSETDSFRLILTLKGYGSYQFCPDCMEHFASLEDVFAPAAEPEPAAAQQLEDEFRRANNLRDNGLFDSAIHLYQQLEAQGHAAAINYLGICYCKGEHLPPSIEMGVRKYRAAARLNYPPALINLGDYHMNSKLGEYDEKEAFSLFMQAASHPEQPDEDAMYRLYLCFKHGIGTPRSPVDAELWRARAAEHGCREYRNFYRVGLISHDGNPLVTGDELLKLVSKPVLCRLIRLSSGEEIRLQDSLILAGSSPAFCALTLPESPDSRHALIRVHENHVILTDLHSSQGTFINQKRISPLEEIILQKDDAIAFGSERFLLADS